MNQFTRQAAERLLFFALTLWAALAGLAASSTPIAKLEYQVAGVQLQVTPAALSVPKGIAGSVMVQIVSGGGAVTNQVSSFAEGTYIEAVLRGPSFPARRLVGRVNEALLLPVLNLVGDYQLDNIRMIDAATGAVRMEGNPSSVPVRVFDEVLISKVTSRPLTMQEITEKGIVVDQSNFRAVEFEVGFVLDGKTIPVRFPVVAPNFNQSVEIIPAAELESRAEEARRINELLIGQVFEDGNFPAELQRPQLNLQVKGIGFQAAGGGDPEDLRLGIPPIPALMVIPGNIGYLNQFFSVQIFTENGAPNGSGLSVHNVRAKMKLPPGPDGILSTNYTQPGDDPLRFARVGTAATNTIFDELPIVGTGASQPTRFFPGEGGKAEFLIEGLQEGLHVMDLDLTADLDGLSAGTVKIAGKASGSVLVRNPKFSLTFAHPRTIRAGEPYSAYVTVLNTSEVMANALNITLRAASISGGLLESAETVQLGDVQPGQTVTAQFRIRAQRTGSVKFSNLTFGEDGIRGRFNLSMGIDERGVELSPDSIGYPSFVNFLPPHVMDAANRVLGQALSVSTAPLLPPGVKPVSRSIVTRRVLELAEAGQRLKLFDATNRVAADVLLDWQGGRSYDAGFDQIVRETDAGFEFRTALTRFMEDADVSDAAQRLLDRAPDVAGRSETWVLGASSSPDVEVGAINGANSTTSTNSVINRVAPYLGTRGGWVVARDQTNLLRWVVQSTMAAAEFRAAVIGTNGSGRQWVWSLSGLSAGSCFTFDPANPDAGLQRDDNCDGTAESILPASGLVVNERPPEVLTVVQDIDVHLSRPWPRCSPGPANSYGQVLGLLFSKPMLQTNVNIPAAYRLDNGNIASGVQVQPGSRVVLLSMREGVSAIRPRTMTVTGVTDARGNVNTVSTRLVTSEFRDGVAVNTRVLRADGSAAANIPVTVTMYDPYKDPFDRCNPIIITRTSQKYTDAEGFVTFDFVHGGVSFTVAAVDTGGLTVEAVTNLLGIGLSGDARFAAEKNAAALAASNLLHSLGVNSVAEAINFVDGLDRAVWSDTIDFNGGRMGREIDIALRFRGRAVVSGRVLGADGQTPEYLAAVNLFPDENSREQVRGMFTTADGRFEFRGVPLGVFSVQVQTSKGHFRTVSGNLTRPRETNEMTIVLTAPTTEEIVRSSLRGRVVEADGVTAVPRARVFVSYIGGIAAVTESDSDGFFTATNLPVKGPLGDIDYRVKALTQDGRRAGESSAVKLNLAGTAFATVTLRGTGVVFGRVEFSNGDPATNALVAGGSTIVRTDAAGGFRITDVPLGQGSVSVGLEAQFAPGGLTRLGQAAVSVLPGVDNFVVVRLPALGRIKGIVRDANGNPIVPSGQGNVAIPLSVGFLWTKVAPDGTFEFAGLAPGEYTISSPAPEVDEEDGDVEKILAGVTGGTSDEVLAAMRSAVGVINRALSSRYGETQATTPGSLGFTRTQVRFDGDEAFVEVRYLPEGSVSGTVINDHEVPIGAAVRLTGLKLDDTGKPVVGILGNRTSDPASGQFSFSRLPMGPWAVQAASPFYPVVIVKDGQTTRDALTVSNLIMRFPAIRSVNGRLAGFVLMPDGTPAGSNVNVQISFGTDYIIRTDTNGFFDTQINIPAGGYTVEARDPATGLRGEAQITVTAGITNYGNVRLLGKGDLEVFVAKAEGGPAFDADIRVSTVGYPSETFTGRTDTNGMLRLGNVFEGRYQVFASQSAGATRLETRADISLAYGTTGRVAMAFGPVGTVRGIFRTLGGQPVAAARVDVGTLASTGTDSAGRFEVAGVGLGTYRVLARDPVSGRLGVATATISSANQVVDVEVIELAQSDVSGVVFQVGDSGPLAGAQVTLSQLNGLAPSRTVTTGPDGSFFFPAVMPGSITILAQSPKGPSRSVVVALVVPDTAASLNTELTIPRATAPTGTLIVQVLEENGVSPASNAVVRAGDAQAVTDETGRTQFELQYGTYTLTAASQVAGSRMSVGTTTTNLSELFTNVTATIRLSGVGTVRGVVLDSSGITPRPGAEVRMRTRSSLEVRGPLADRTGTALTDSQGRFEFNDMAVGPYEFVATSGPLRASGSGTITNAGQVAEITLQLGDSGTVTGRLVRADGVTPVVGNLIAATFLAPSGLDGIRSVYTGEDGGFFLDGIPVGIFKLEALRIETLGLVNQSLSLSANGQVLNVGDVVMDEDWPAVTMVNPAPSTLGVSINTGIDLTFSEPIATNSIPRNGIILSGPTSNVPAVVSWGPVTNGATINVRLQPLQPLRSLTTYRVSVFDGERRDGFGALVGIGPADRVGRSLLQPFTSTFTTRDDDPPQLVSVFPTNGAVQIDPRAVPRFSFSEPIQASNAVFTLSGPGGVIPGTLEVGFNGLVLSFTPSQPLPVNSEITFTASGVRDLSGNLAANQPYEVRFKTLDTLGPTLAFLRVADGKSPVRNAPVELEVALSEPESGVTIRFTRDLTAIGAISNGATRLPIVLPASGSAIYRAIAADRWGNDGPIIELQITVVADEPPTVALTRAFPISGGVGNGEPFTVNVSATDDVAVTNVVVQGPLGDLARFGNGTARIVNLVMPSNAVAGSVYQLRARATDWIGSVSPEVGLDIPVVDRAVPLGQIVSPPAGTLLNPSMPFVIAIASSDNSTNHFVEVRLSGPLSATQQLSVVTSPNSMVTNSFTFSLTNVPTSGATVTATIRVSDSSSNLVTLSRNYVVPDTRPPQLTQVTPPSGSTNQSLWRSVVLDFDEALDPLAVTTNSFVVTNSAAVPTPISVALENGNQRIRIVPQVALRPGTVYTNVVLPQITDVKSNRWQSLGGAVVSQEGAAFEFTTARVLNTEPTNGSSFLVGQAVQAALLYDAGLGATHFRFMVNGELVTQVAAGSTNTRTTVVLPTNGTTAAISVAASNAAAGAMVYAFEPIIVNLLPLSSDRDGDGMSDAFEITYNLDPFVNDAARDEDGDGLTNLQEFLAGTNPRSGDTDGDGIPDNVDPAPLSANHPPLVAFTLTTNLDASITITLGGTDSDGDAVVSRLTGLPSPGGLFLTADGTTRGALVTNVPTVVTGVVPRVIFVPLGIVATNELRYKVSDGFAESGVATLTFISTNNPLADADGDTMPDQFELVNQLNPFANDAALDPDADGLSNVQEWQRGTLPRVADTDQDSLNDGAEVALGTDPLNADTDGDGIPDGTDPNPLGINSGLAFSGTNRVDVTEGQSAVLTLQVDSTNGPVVLLDYAATNLPPTFVTMRSRTFANSSSNGVATIQLELNPLHDAAGEWVVTVRAANRAGESTTHDVRLVVANNPSLAVTRWKDAVSGNWNDAARWDNGVPGPATVALIDVAGSYTVSLNANVNATGVIVDSTNAVVQPAASLTVDAPVEVRRGRFDVSSSATVTLNRPLANRDRMRWISAYNTFTLTGTGRLENLGQWEIYRDPATSFGSESVVRVAVNVPAGGKIFLSSNALVNLSAGSSLTMSGELEVQSGARLRLDNTTPPSELTFTAESQLIGAGVVQVDGGSPIVALRDLDTTVPLVLNNTAAQLLVIGTYTMRTSHNVNGTIQAPRIKIATNTVVTANAAGFAGPVTVESNATLRLQGGTVTFSTNVAVLAGGRLDVSSGMTVMLNGVLANAGTMRWISTYNSFALNGTGRVENLGEWEIYRDPAANFGTESVVRVPVNVPVGGKLLLSAEGLVNFSAGSSLTVAGALEVRAGARLRMDNTTPPRDLTFTAGSELSGTGPVQVDGASRIVALRDVDTTVPLVLNNGSAQLLVDGTYTMRANQNVNGTIQAARLVVGTNAVVTANAAGFVGLVTVESNATLRLQGGTVTFSTNVAVVAGGRLDVNSGMTVVLNGVLTNAGTMRWISAYNTFALNGTGRVENQGVWEIYRDPAANFGSESVVRIPVNVPMGGKLLLSAEGQVNFSAGSSLTVAGELEVRAGARLRLDNTAPARDMMFTAESQVTGTGVVQVDGNSRVIAAQDLDTSVAFVLNNASAQLLVTRDYKMRANQNVNGTILAGRIVVGTNAVVTANAAGFMAPVTVESNATLRLQGGTVTFSTNVAVLAEGRLDVSSGTTVVLDGVLTNAGTMRWISAYNTFALNGTGRVENQGVWEIYRDPQANFGSESVVRMPVNVPVGGKLLLSSEGFVNFAAGSSLTVAGELEVRAGARLRLDNTTPARDLTLLAGSTLTGTGTIQIEGSCRMIVPGDLDTTVAVVVNSTDARLIIPGVYTVRSSRTLVGFVGSSAVIVTSNAVLTANNAQFTGPVTLQSGAQLVMNQGSFTNQVTIESEATLRLAGGTVTFITNVTALAGSRFDVSSGTTVVLNGALTNAGTMRWISAYNTFTLNGAGRVENEGVWEIYRDPQANFGSESVVRVPVNVPVSGKLLLSTEGQVNFAAGSSLTVAGELEVRAGARLRMDSSTPARDLTLLAGSSLTGTGTIQIEGSCRMLVPGDLDSTVAVVVNSATARLVVPGVYTVRSSRTIAGLVDSTAVIVTTNAVLTANSANFVGPVTLEAGAQLVMSNGSFTNRVTIEGGATMRLAGGTVTFMTNVTAMAGSRLDVFSTTVVLNGALTNAGSMRWVSAYNTFTLNGAGRVESEGIWEIYRDPQANFGSESVVRVPVNVPAGGLFLVSTEGFVNFAAGSSFTVAGQLEVQAGARVRLDGTTPSRDLTLLAGSMLSGVGTIQIEGSCRMLVPGDLDATVAIVVNSSTARLVVPGVYTVRSSRIIAGLVDATAVVVTTNAVLTANSANFMGPVTLQPGAQLVMNNGSFTNRVTIEGGATMRLVGGTITFVTNVTAMAESRFDVFATTVVLNGALTNAGTMRWVSAYNTFTLNGAGRVESEGVWEIYRDPQANFGSESTVRVPVNVPAGGRFLLSSEGFVNFSSGSSLAVAGQMEVQAGARVRLDNTIPARDLTLQSGSMNSGSGTVLLEGANRLVLGGDTTLNFGLVSFAGTSTLVNNNTLIIASGAAVRFDHSSTNNGPITVNGALSLTVPSATLRINSPLTLNSGGSITNSGTISVAAFVNNGGQITGNPPVVAAAPSGSPALLISAMPAPLSGFAAGSGTTPVANVLMLKWTAASGERYLIESTTNLRTWTTVSAVITETSPGVFQSTISADPAGGRFFRLRRSN